MEVSGQFHAPDASPPVKDPRYHWFGVLVGFRAALDAVAKRKLPCLCWESNLGHLARSLVTVLTEVM